MAQPSIEFDRVRKVFCHSRQNLTIVDEVTMAVPDGDVCALVGHSGCGKSTLLNIAAGLITPSAGCVRASGKAVTRPEPERAVVFQSPRLLPWLSIVDNVALAVPSTSRFRGRQRALVEARSALQRVGFDGSESAFPRELSHGAQRRVAMARALVASPRLLLLDEPLTGLDTVARAELQEEIARHIESDGMSALLVTHDVDEALFLSDAVALMTSGPSATIAEIVKVPFPRPRDRGRWVIDTEYLDLRKYIVKFLEDQPSSLRLETSVLATQ